MHSDNKKNNGTQDKSELSDIKEYTTYNREEKHIYQTKNRIKEEKGQTWQKFRFIPFHCKKYGNECNNHLNNFIEDNARCQKCRDHFNVHLSSRISVLVYLMVGINFKNISLSVVYYHPDIRKFFHFFVG